MRSLPVRIGAGIVGGAFLLVVWVSFAPTKLGGSTTYAVTSGISMEPLLHKNDLTFVRAQSTYHVGDAVLYQSQVLHQPVLHRIILIQHGNYFFQGDNNSFVDPGYATRSELVGKLWFHVSSVGAVLTWFGKPTHAAVLAALAVLAIVLAGATTTKSRRRRRRGPRPMSLQDPAKPTVPIRHESPASPTSMRQASGRRPPPYLEGPTASLVALGVVLALAVLLIGVGYTKPVHRPGVLPDAYSQAGTFSYSAAVNAPNAVYPTGVVTTGDPIYPSLVDTVSLRFGYRFTSRLPHDVKGTVEMRALVLSKTDTWQELSTVAPVTAFSGDKATVTSDLSLTSLYSFIDQVTSQSGIAGTNYSVDIQPVVHLTGTVGGQSVDRKFSPVLPFAVAQTAIRLDVATAAPPPGATYVPSSGGAELAAALHPAASGTIPHVVGNDLTIAKYHVPVSLIRTLGIIFGVLALAIAVLHDRLRRRMPRRSEEEQIAGRLHALIVPVDALGTPGRPPVTVPDFASLAGLARFLERPILYEVSGGSRTFAVDDDALRYVTPAIDRRQGRARNEEAEPRDPDPPPPAPDGPPSEAETSPTATRRHRQPVVSSAPAHRWSTGTLLVRVGAVLLVVAVAATLTLSFTATTTVPASRVGQSFQPGAVTQASPAGCSALPLTSLVRGSGTFSSSASYALILGSAGVDRINATGQYNCIVGGGGKDNVTGTATAVCIIGPTAGATYSSCTKRA